MGGWLALIILEISLPARSGVGGGPTRSSLGRLPGARQWARFTRKLGQTNNRSLPTPYRRHETRGDENCETYQLSLPSLFHLTLLSLRTIHYILVSRPDVNVGCALSAPTSSIYFKIEILWASPL